MKKVILLGIISLTSLNACTESKIANVSEKKLIRICSDIAQKQAQKESYNGAIDLHYQRGIEEVCKCVARKMPSTLTVNEFVTMVNNNGSPNVDYESTDKIVERCMEEMEIQGYRF